jgi:hypothetical protein
MIWNNTYPKPMYDHEKEERDREEEGRRFREEKVSEISDLTEK